ncbi:unnamed protein product [Callosobruchus maculatus]|uniref:Uncharacterized protein n=1 Tax=Callosobruchus maculatus TaxID=64391 RepID=A0A653DVD4_CALMS|nr:unnamed protein product [Callosobruchus maculatus]
MNSEEEAVSKLLNHRNQAGLQFIHLWNTIGEEEAYAEETKKLKILQNVLRKQINEVERETKALEPLVKVTASTLESLKETFEVNSMSVIIHNEHEKCVMDQVKEMKERTNDLLDRYSNHIDECKEELENDNPECKILHDLTVQKKKVKLDCLLLEEKIKQIQYKNRVLEEVSYKQIIDFSKSWLERRLFEEKKKTLKQLKLEQKNWLRKLMEVTERSKYNQKMRYIKGTMCMTKTPEIEFSQPTDTKPLVDKKSDTEKNQLKQKAPAVEIKKPFNELELLLENTEQFKPTKTSNVTQNFVSSTCVPKSVFTPDHTKVLVLDNQLLNSKMKRTLTKEERSKEYGERLQKVFTNLKRKIFHQPSSEAPRVKPTNTNTEAKEMKATAVKSNTKDIAPSQELLLYSQDESEMKFASQQSEAAAERNAVGPANMANQRAHLDMNQNQSIPTKMKRVTFSDKDKASDSFFMGNKQMEKDSYPFAMMNMNSSGQNTFKASEEEYNQFSMSFAGVRSGATFPNFAGTDEGLFKIPNTPTGEYDSSMMLSPLGGFCSMTNEQMTGKSDNQEVAFSFGAKLF